MEVIGFESDAFQDLLERIKKIEWLCRTEPSLFKR